MALPAVGFSTWAFPGEGIDRSIDHALAHEFAALEVALLDPALFDREDLIPSDDQARRVAQRTPGVRLSVHAPIDQVSLADPDPDIRHASVDTMRRAIEAARHLGAEVLVCHLTRSYRDPDVPLSVDESGRAFAAEHLHELGLAAADAALVLAVENVGISNRAADRDYSGLCETVDRVGLDNVGITLDLGHAHVHQKQCGGVAASAELFGRRVRHYHVHDNDGTADQHRRLGAGTIDYTSLLPWWASGYTGILALEIFPFIETAMVDAILASRNAVNRLLQTVQ